MHEKSSHCELMPSANMPPHKNRRNEWNVIKVADIP